MTSDTKHCGGCNTDKPLDDFHKNSSRKDGRSTQCKVCINTRNKVWYTKNKERHNALGKANYNANGEKYRDRNYRKKYGITLEQYNQILENQNGLCALCNQPETAMHRKSGGKLRELAVDHCHETGKIRGLLCTKCNVMISNLGDTIERAEKLVKYMKGSN